MQPVRPSLDPATRRRLAIQGLDAHDDHLEEVIPWHRMAFALCGGLVCVGTIGASAEIMWGMVPVALLGALLPFHPFDLLYNLGIRHIRRTRPLPRRGAPGRFACGVASVWLVVTALALESGLVVLGTSLGALMTMSAWLVSTTDICIPSMAYHLFFSRGGRRLEVLG